MCTGSIIHMSVNNKDECACKRKEMLTVTYPHIHKYHRKVPPLRVETEKRRQRIEGVLELRS